MAVHLIRTHTPRRSCACGLNSARFSSSTRRKVTLHGRDFLACGNTYIEVYNASPGLAPLRLWRRFFFLPIRARYVILQLQDNVKIFLTSKPTYRSPKRTHDARTHARMHCQIFSMEQPSARILPHDRLPAVQIVRAFSRHLSTRRDRKSVV